MQRMRSSPRPNWEKIVEGQGLQFHTLEGLPYWDESVYYRFTAGQIDELEKATYALDELCLQAVEHIVAERRFDELALPAEYIDWVTQSWENDEFTLYGRFDLAYDGHNPPKMLEYNADTPTALLEAAVIQWFWLKDLHPQADQFNSLHERLIEAWKSYAHAGREPLCFASLAGNIEDYMTVNYLRDTAIQAGHDTHYLEVEAIGWNVGLGGFMDDRDRPLRQVFKLYPWEWMLREQFGPQLKTAGTHWLEPPWKMLLSNKAILPILYELFPDCPYLLEAAFEPLAGAYVRKPLYSREGANIALMNGEQVLMETGGAYQPPYIYQRYCPLPQFDGNYPVIGSWMVNGYACGIGIREDVSPVTHNTSRFVPHLFE